MQTKAGQQSGTTAVIVVINLSHKSLDPSNTAHVAVVGDTRFVIGYANGTYKATTDHKPLPEKERIEKAGGVVRQVDGVWRINNSLSVSRTLGDCYLKNQGVTADPDYY